MRKFFAVIAIAPMLAGCAPITTKFINSTEGLQGKRLAVNSNSMLDFSDDSAGKVVLAAVCAIATIHVAMNGLGRIKSRIRPFAPPIVSAPVRQASTP